MSKITKISIVDEDVRRRAAIGFALSSGNIHAEPFESVEELLSSDPNGEAVLVHDVDGVVAGLARQLANRGVSLPIIAFGIDPAPSRIVAAVRSGASDYLAWPCEADEIVAALDRLEPVEAPVPASAAFTWANNADARLTRREREVLAAAAEGLPNKEIGRKLNISPRTVEVHRSRALHKIGAKNIAEAVGSVFGIRFSA